MNDEQPIYARIAAIEAAQRPPEPEPHPTTHHYTAISMALLLANQTATDVERQAARFLHFIKTGSFDGAPE